MNINTQPSMEGKVQKPFIKGFKFPIYPTPDQIELLEKSFGCCRFIWNKALNDAKAEYESYMMFKDTYMVNPPIKPNLTGFSFVNKLPKYKAEFPWLYDTPANVLQQTMLHLGTAFSTFFKNRKGYPNFKKKFYSDSITLMGTDLYKKGNDFYMCKSKEPLAIGFSRVLPSNPSSAVISKSSTGMYFISFICTYIPTKTSGTGIIGIDLGLKDFIVDSNGNRIANPKHLAKQAKNLKRKQQILARCKKGSSNRTKARIAVAKIHESISNTRNTFQHQVSRKLINENQVIGIERLVVKNMIKNRKLSKAIADIGWSSFVQKLIYKARESQHCNIVQMDAFYPSTHICNDTHLRIKGKLKLSQREWLCPLCGKVHDRDINAAKNIRDEAIFQIEYFNIPPTGILILANNRE